MKKIMLLVTSVIMAATLAACSPTSDKSQSKRSELPAGAEQQTTVDGLAEKMEDVAADPTVTVCVYSIKEDKSGLKQNMDAVDGTELDAQLLIDKMAELGVVETGIRVQSFENKNGVLSLDLSALANSGDKQIQTAIANTFLQNYEADDGELMLSVNGTKVSDENLKFNKEYKTLK